MMKILPLKAFATLQGVSSVASHFAALYLFAYDTLDVEADVITRTRLLETRIVGLDAVDLASLAARHEGQCRRLP